MSITIRLNGKPFTAQTAATVTALLQEHSLHPEHVVVEINEQIIPRENYTSHKITNDDVVEILRFVGGG